MSTKVANTSMLTSLFDGVYSIFSTLLSYFMVMVSYLVPSIKDDNMDYKSLDPMTKDALLDYVKTRKVKPYDINQQSVQYLEKMKVDSNNIFSNLLEMTKKLSDAHPKVISLENMKSKYSKKRVYFAPYDLMKDYTEEPKESMGDFPYFELKKGKGFDKSKVTKDEFMVSFGDDKYNTDMMTVSKKFLQVLSDYYHTKLVAFYNKFLQDGSDPKYAFGKVCFSYKGKGSKQDLKSYRKITTLPNTINHFHRILALRIGKYVDENEYFDRNIQKAGLSGCNFGIFEQVFKLRSVIKDANQNNRPAAVLFLDMSAAFDNIDRTKVLKTLEAYGVDDKVVNYIKTFYENLHFYVSSRGKAGELRKWNSGLVQGCSLSPLLFTLSMNYILAHINKTSLNADGYKFSDSDCKMLLLAFMDDICITCNSLESMNEVYVELKEFLSTFGLSINRTKSALMLINQTDEVPETMKDVPVVTKQKYLGNMITSDGNYTENYDSVKRDIYGKLSSIKRSKEEDKEPLFRQLLPSIKRALLKLYDVEGDDMGKIVYMIQANLKEMDIDPDQYEFAIKETRDYVLSISEDKVLNKIPEKLNKVKKEQIVKPNKADLEDLKEAYENTRGADEIRDDLKKDEEPVPFKERKEVKDLDSDESDIESDEEEEVDELDFKYEVDEDGNIKLMN